ncbi:MAG: hypothetical protein MPJ78_08675 [Hyphomicrobiaceae bacterium]|nr:hypothetical protein [Hyphomicrobiaceae bacterium]
MTELKDELLVAYVEGQLAKDQSKAIKRVLEEDQVAAQRVEALKAAHDHLESAFEAMMAGEVKPSDEAAAGTLAEPATYKKPSVFRGILRRSAALTPLGLIGPLVTRSLAFLWVGLGCLIGGVAAGYLLYDQIKAEPFETVIVIPPEAPVATQPSPAPPAAVPAAPTWGDDIARAHTLLSRDTFSTSLLGEGNADLVGFKIAKVFGKEFQIPDLSAEDLIFQRAQMLQHDGVPFAQVAYLPKKGAPLALYAKETSGIAQPIQIREKDGLSLAAWTHRGLEMLLAGSLPEDKLRAVAHTINEQLSGSEPVKGDTGIPTPPISPESTIDLRDHVTGAEDG